MTAPDPPVLWTGPPLARRDYRVTPGGMRRGGQGILFIACLDSDRLGAGMTGAQVGLKQLTGIHAERWAKLVERSKRLATLDHPGLARHLETFTGPAPCNREPPEDECDLYYSSHLWVMGETLAEVGGQVRPEVALARIGQLGGTLDFLHGLPEGPIAHRDLHPGNVVITGAGEAVIIDYETALPFEDPIPATSMLIGRVGFIPPERTTDPTAPADAGDRWQLGMLAVFTLLGYPQGAMPGTLLARHLMDRLEGQVSNPSDTTEAVMAMLAERPGDRPKSCCEWAASLHQSLDGPSSATVGVPFRRLTGDGIGDAVQQAATHQWGPLSQIGRPARLAAAIVAVLIVGLVGWWSAFRGEGGPRTVGPTTTVATTVRVAIVPEATITTLPSTGAEPSLITTAPDGVLWFTEQRGDSIWKIPPGGVPTQVVNLPPGSHPFGITTAPDGSIWFTEGEADGSSGDAVGRLNPNGDQTLRVAFPKGSEPTGIVVAPDGRIWITAYGGKAVYWISSDGQSRGGPFPMSGNPNRIVVGPDGNIWVTIATGPKVVVLSQDGVPIREYLVMPGPTDIVVAADGKVWLTSFTSNSVQWIDTRTGQVSEPTEILGGPGALVVGSDGNLWLTQLSGRSVSAVSPAGDRVATVPVQGGTPFGITSGHDGAIWFTVLGVSGQSPDAIGRIAVRR